MMDKDKLQTLRTYEATAQSMTDKFDSLGVRADDVHRAFSLVDADSPRVLEIGCGSGREAEEIAKYPSDYLGIDISARFLEIARKRLPASHFEQADVEEYAFPNDLDIIFSFASLLHSSKERLGEIFLRMHTALNGGGIVYISLKEGNYERVIKNDEFGRRVFYFYRLTDIKDLIGSLFEVVWEDHQSLRGQEWFTVVLRKK